MSSYLRTRAVEHQGDGDGNGDSQNLFALPKNQNNCPVPLSAPPTKAHLKRIRRRPEFQNSNMALFGAVDKSELFTPRISTPFGALKRKAARRYIRARAVPSARSAVPARRHVAKLARA